MKNTDLPSNTEPIAVIGMACRFPGRASDISGFWDVLQYGWDEISVLPKGRFSFDRYYSGNENISGRSYTLAAGVIDGIKDFDPYFFGISRKEAMDMDPQQRLALEVAWHCLENAGLRPSILRGSSTGVYFGASALDNSLQIPDDPCVASPYSMTGANLSIIANRISHVFDFHGPSLTVDTACSSSLLAVHLACEALRSGEVPLALAGGVNILLAPYGFIGFSKARMLSPDGRCKVFDAAGNGYVRSEGGGCLLLKPLSKAIKDNDQVIALIAGSGANSDGHTTGLALPNGEMQAGLLTQVYDRFHLDKNKLVYVEAHGTGTTAGDPVEARSIGTVLGSALKGRRVLPIGSAKGNVGHLEAASGVVGVIKGLLVLQHGKIPANLHFNTPNPDIDFDGLNIRVPRQLTSLPRLGGAELISVNSFGFGGANAHVVLQRPPARRKKRVSPRRGDILPPLFLSASSAHSLRALAKDCASILAGKDALFAYDFAAGLVRERELQPLRKIIRGESVAALVANLEAYAAAEETSRPPVSAVRPQATGQGVFVFSGNGSQWCGMGHALYNGNECFRKSIEETDSLLSGYQNWSIVEAFSRPDTVKEAFDRAETNQPMLFALQVGLVRALEEKGLKPSAVIGHSVGEIAAAWAAGALSLRDACKVIYYRSVLQGASYGTGRMAVANISAAEAENILAESGCGIEISAVNSPRSVTLSGTDETAFASFLELCKSRRVAAKMLPLPYPYHTSAMESIRAELLSALSDISPRAPRIPFFSTVHGKELHAAPDAAYWFANLRNPVLFEPAAKAAYGEGFIRFLEVGPNPVLRSYLRATFSEAGRDFSVLPSLLHTGKECEDFETTWISAWEKGWDLDPKRCFPWPHRRVDLPSYSWNREYLWPDDTVENRGFLKQERVHPLLGWPLPGNAPVYENIIAVADFPWLGDHIVGNGMVYPAAAFLESALAAAACLHPEKQIEIERLSILRPLGMEEQAASAMRVALDREDGGLRIESRKYMSAEPWGTYVKGRILPQAESPADPGLSFVSPEAFGMEVGLDSLYGDSRTMFRYGKAFRTVEKAWMRPDVNRPEILIKLSRPDHESAKGMFIPPTLIDGAMQSLFILMAVHKGGKRRTYLPVSFDKIVMYAAGSPRYAHTCLERIGAKSIVASFRLLDQSGNTLLLLNNCRFRRALWLEHEHSESRPYALELAHFAHPEKVEPLEGGESDKIAHLAEKCIQTAVNATAKDSGIAIHPYLLLQLAALSSVHESVLTLCGRPARGLQCSSRELVEAGVLDSQREAWFNALLERLKDGELAARSNDRWQVQPAGDRVRAETLWRTILSASPAYLPEASLLAHTFRQRDSLFAGSGMTNAEQGFRRLALKYFSNSIMLRPFNKAACKIVESVLMAGKSGQNINILHVAQEPTALIADLLPLLEARPCKYVVAEKNESSAEADAIRFGAAPSLDFCVMEPENSGPEHKGRYHLILLLWSLHQHINSAKMLESCRDMLAPGGLICVVEHGHSVFTDYVFGASPQWWAASPTEGQPVSLMQGATYWQRALEKAFFEDVCCAGASEKAYCPAFIVTANKSGAVSPKEEQPIAENALAPGAPDPATEKESEARWMLVVSPERENSLALGLAMERELRDKGKKTSLVPYSPKGKTKDEAAENWWLSTLALDAHETDQTPLHVVFLAGYDNRQDASAQEWFTLQTNSCIALSGLVRAWESLRPELRLWVVSGGALVDGISDSKPVPSQATLAGFVRVMGNELRRVHSGLLDLHADDSTALLIAPELINEILHPTDDREVVFSSAGRYVPRLSRFKFRSSRTNEQGDKPAALLQFDTPGRLQNLYWTRVPLPRPAPDEVCVEVRYTGLNFRDVMWSMGLLPDEALENGFSGPSMGMECSGVITEVGRKVKEWKPGDEVICFAPACFGSHALTKATAVVRKPAIISFAEGATIPVAFTTAWYSLKHLARLQPGESVLIHGAAGGVGLAAIQIATHLGLEVYATAGSPEKHDFLRQLGLTRIYSSRSLAFARQILEDTGGKGVDAVLNSLAGEAIPAGVSVLRPFGRFLELGKRDFFSDNPLRLRPFSNNISFFGIDIDQLVMYQPQLAQQLFAELMALFEERELVPLPLTLYPVTRTVEAFQTMQQSSHIGKIIVSMEGGTDIARQPEPVFSKAVLKPNATYLITGGSGGFGLAAANRLARRGAKHIILLSRRGIAGKEAEEMVASIRAIGASIIEARADVSDRDQLFACLAGHLKNLPPLRGVIHGAAALDDTLITGLDEKRINSSLAAKVLGALHLHAITLDLPLDFFVMHSSVSSVFGNPGQSMYVAANSALENLGGWRRSRGLPAQVIGWGPIADTGMMARQSQSRDQIFKMLGIASSSAHDALYWLEHCIAEKVGESYYFGLDWYGRADLPLLRSPRFNRLCPASQGNEGIEIPTVDEIRGLPPEEGKALVLQLLVDEISRVLRMPKDRLNPDTPLIAQGMDSLMAVELALAVEQKFELPGYNLALAESSTVKDLAGSLYAHIKESGGGRSEGHASDEEMVHGLERKHGFKLSDQNLESVMQSMKERQHEQE